tara:strand:- start:146 stop:451 length:306 start_codon:yes stop_codon:yes gene_type:complete
MKKIKEFFELLLGVIFLAIIGYYFFYDILFAFGALIATAILFGFIILGFVLIYFLIQKFGFNFDNPNHIKKLESLAVLLIALATYSFIAYFLFSWIVTIIL